MGRLSFAVQLWHNPALSMDTISCEISDHIATVTLQKTTMPPLFFTEIERLFEDLAHNDALRVVVIQAAGKVFSYGLDLPAAFAELGPHLRGGLAGERTRLLRLIRRLQRSMTAVAECPVPVIAAVHGWCVGGGLDLISACDIRLACKKTKISLRETKVAIVADLGSLQRLPAIIGQGHTRELAFSGRDIYAARAKEIGLFNEVYQDREEVHKAALALATEIAQNPPLTVRGVKDVLDYSRDKSVADGLEYVAVWNSAFLASADLGEAMTAFATKRPPEFKGE